MRTLFTTKIIQNKKNKIFEKIINEIHANVCCISSAVTNSRCIKTWGSTAYVMDLTHR